jgi:hypothetical protein
MRVVVMTVQLSPHKVSKILRGYFCGLPQTKIAKEAGVDQSSISHYATGFKKMAAKYGLPAAGKEYQVLNEVESLRSLSVELYKSKLTMDEVRQGHNIIKAFLNLGIGPNQHIGLIEVCKKVDDLGFINAALKLNRIEAEGQMSYEKATSKFERITSELPPAENRLRGILTKLKSLNNLIAQRNSELTNVEAHVVQLQKRAKAKEAKLEQEFGIKMKRLNVQYKEVEAVAKLKTGLSKQGLDLPTLLKLATEFK